MTATEVASLSVGVAALALALYSKRKQSEAEDRQKELIKKQEKMEQRIERKEELREAAEDFREVVDWIDQLQTDLSSLTGDGVPFYDHVDSWGSTVHLAKDAVSYTHFTGSNARISVSVIRFDEEGEKVHIDSSEAALKLIEDFRSPGISLSLDDQEGYSDEFLFAYIDDALSGANRFKFQKESIGEKHEEVLQDFAPEILDDLESVVDDIIRGCMGQALEAGPYIEIDPDEFEKVDDIAEYLFNETLRYDGIDEDLQQLEQMKKEMEDMRKAIVQTSYS